MEKHTMKAQFVHLQVFQFRHARVEPHTLYPENTPPECHTWGRQYAARTCRMCTRKYIFEFCTNFQIILILYQIAPANSFIAMSPSDLFGIIKFSSTFQRTLPSLKVAVPDLKNELSNSRDWMSDSFCNFSKNTIFVEYFLESLGVVITPRNASFAFVVVCIEFFSTFVMPQPNYNFAISVWGKELPNAFGRPWFREELEDFSFGISNSKHEFVERIHPFYQIVIMYFMPMHRMASRKDKMTISNMENFLRQMRTCMLFWPSFLVDA